jgi:hypothetical protein
MKVFGTQDRSLVALATYRPTIQTLFFYELLKVLELFSVNVVMQTSAT